MRCDVCCGENLCDHFLVGLQRRMALILYRHVSACQCASSNRSPWSIGIFRRHPSTFDQSDHRNDTGFPRLFSSVCLCVSNRFSRRLPSSHTMAAQQSLTVLVAGASGDLAKNKTYPALLQLWQANLLPRQTVIWGFARTKKSTADFRQHLEPYVKGDQSFLEMCEYSSGKSYGDWEVILDILQRANADNVLVYLAIPPHVFGETTQAVKTALQHTYVRGFTRVVLEKPFGRDTDSCQALLSTLREQQWSEHDLYRIDHYLGKEMVQNILTMRRHNAWLRPLWNRHTVRSVHIVFKEPFGTEGRGGYFDPYGIVRDILQNHLLQVLTLIAMELPEKWTADEIRDAKVRVLKSMPILTKDDCLLGQYVGYKDDPTIENRDTVTPTYACVRMRVDNDTWRGVPFCLEAGKALEERLCEVRLHLSAPGDSQPNVLVLRLQPFPAIFLTANIKTPGFSSTPVSTHMGIDYGDSGGPEAYTRLLLNVLRGQQASFVRDDELLQAWKLFTPMLEEIEHVTPRPYTKGTMGPDERQDFLHAMGVAQPWLPPPSSL